MTIEIVKAVQYCTMINFLNVLYSTVLYINYMYIVLYSTYIKYCTVQYIVCTVCTVPYVAYVPVVKNSWWVIAGTTRRKRDIAVFVIKGAQSNAINTLKYK